jgi:hypothetical protein
MDKLLAAIKKAHPIPVRFRKDLPNDVAELSRILTFGRSELKGGYLGRPNLLSAYLYYFLPWNVWRLEKVFQMAPVAPDTCVVSDAVTDLGAGPLTLPLALWTAFPELRAKPIEFRCIDANRQALKAGEAVFRALAGDASPWKLNLVTANMFDAVRGGKCAFVSAINVYNEIFWKLKHDDDDSLFRLAEREAARFGRLCGEGGSVLIMEPGIPLAGRFLAALRAELLTAGWAVRAPCTHNAACPTGGAPVCTAPAGSAPTYAAPAGAAGKWCHFAFETTSAPATLHRLSGAAGLPKERATLGFLFAQKGGSQSLGRGSATDTGRRLRVISDPFPLPDGAWGRYACAEWGLTLLKGGRQRIAAAVSGSLIESALPAKTEHGIAAGAERDAKTGAAVYRL